VAKRGRPPAGGPDTRKAILAAALDQFAENGFERTTIRAVAAQANVDPALIAHYFVNKDGLLAAALVIPFDPAVVLSGLDVDRETAGAEIIRRILTLCETTPAVPRHMAAMLRTGLSHDYAAGLMRDVLGRTVLAVLGELVEPDGRELRAALLGSQLTGLLLARYMIQVPGVAHATTEEIIQAMAPVLQHYLTGPLETPQTRPSRDRGT
jgi:AcrR family transcriptional regulator